MGNSWRRTAAAASKAAADFLSADWLTGRVCNRLGCRRTQQHHHVSRCCAPCQVSVTHIFESGPLANTEKQAVTKHSLARRSHRTTNSGRQHNSKVTHTALPALLGVDPCPPQPQLHRHSWGAGLMHAQIWTGRARTQQGDNRLRCAAHSAQLAARQPQEEQGGAADSSHPFLSRECAAGDKLDGHGSLLTSSRCGPCRTG